MEKDSLGRFKPDALSQQIEQNIDILATLAEIKKNTVATWAHTNALMEQLVRSNRKLEDDRRIGQQNNYNNCTITNNYKEER